MLVLTAKISDGPIHFIDKNTGEHIEVQLLGIKQGQIRLGFSASDNIDILRDVLYVAGGYKHDES